MYDYRWDRPECKWKAADGDSLVFQQMDVDYTMGQPIDVMISIINGFANFVELFCVMKGMPGSRVGPVPIVRMFGVTREGNRFVLRGMNFFVQCNHLFIL